MDGDGHLDLSRHPEPPARTPQKIEEQERLRLHEAKKDPSELQEDRSELQEELQEEQVSRHRRDKIPASRRQEDHDPVRHPEPPAFELDAPLYHQVCIKQPSSTSQNGSPAPAGAGTTTRVRQSVLYSDRPRRSRGRPGRAPVEEHAGEVSSSEGSTVMDLSEFKALALSDTPPKLELTDRSNECAHGTASSKTDSEIIEEEKPKDESDYYLGEKMCSSEDYWKDIPVFDSLDDAFEYLEKSNMASLARAGYDLTLAHYRETSTSMVAPEQEVPTSIVAPEQEVPTSMVAPEQEVPTSMVAPEQEVPAGGLQEIARNGKKWMSEEAMVAFKKYMEKNDDIKGFEYQFDELLYQCFNVEHYFKTFHHFNFTVKMRAPGSADWTSQLYFAEVKEILRQKNYICYPLEPDEEGYCYACENQGMDELRHPLVGGFDTGGPDTMLPYGVILDSEDEDCEIREPGVESDDEPY